MIVYVLEVGHHDDTRVFGVFSSVEAAKAVPVVESEVYQRPANPERATAWREPSREWDDQIETGGWYREADGGFITAHTLDAVPVSPDPEAAE